MFKRGFKKVLCSGLVLGLLLGLTACGKQKEEETVSGWGEDNTALAREFVYGEQILKIPEYLGNASVIQTAKLDSCVFRLNGTACTLQREGCPLQTGSFLSYTGLRMFLPFSSRRNAL